MFFCRQLHVLLLSMVVAAAACRDELVVYLFFSPIYSSLYFHVLSTILRKSSFTICIYIYR